MKKKVFLTTLSSGIGLGLPDFAWKSNCDPIFREATIRSRFPPEVIFNFLTSERVFRLAQ
jgi:hypothetical protein